MKLSSFFSLPACGTRGCPSHLDGRVCAPVCGDRMGSVSGDRMGSVCDDRMGSVCGDRMGRFCGDRMGSVSGDRVGRLICYTETRGTR